MGEHLNEAAKILAGGIEVRLIEKIELQAIEEAWPELAGKVNTVDGACLLKIDHEIAAITDEYGTAYLIPGRVEWLQQEAAERIVQEAIDLVLGALVP